MSCEGAVEFQCVTQRVIDGLQKHGVKGWSAFEVTPKDVPRLVRLRLPKLYALGVDNHWGALDLDASGFSDSTFCPECHKFTSPYRDPQQLVLDEDSFDWEASDFFSYLPFGLGVFVTRRVIEIARSERWTNARFRKHDAVFFRSREIDYLANRWPPPGWN
ncbi:MAG: hypothetical protein ED559_04050 [Phycisphaera sp.]|nr:MAG: hypothetical protein ED559_04050 [Phycisphaera sp.]